MDNKQLKEEMESSATLTYMVKKKIPLTVENFVEMNWGGEYTYQDLDAEQISEIPSVLRGKK